MIAEQLNAALRRKGWSITEAAAASGVSRPFLSRLLSGQDPPRSRAGHLTAEHDERYRHLAEVLDLDPESFVGAVARSQRGQPAKPVVPAILRKRYPKFSDLIARNQPLRHTPDLVRLMTGCLAETVPERKVYELKNEVLKQLGKAAEAPPFKTQPFIEHDYLGIPSNLRLPIYGSRRAQTCREIGYALVEAGDPGDECTEACVEIAMLFYDLALLDGR